MIGNIAPMVGLLGTVTGMIFAFQRVASTQGSAGAAELARYMRAGGRSPRLLKKLASLQDELGERRAAAETLERLNYIYPVADAEMHQHLGELWLAEGDLDAAIREFRAVVALNPIDLAKSEFNLARAYRAADRNDEAFEHIVLALEAAPGFRPAQKMLLELSAHQRKE